MAPFIDNTNYEYKLDEIVLETDEELDSSDDDISPEHNSLESLIFLQYGQVIDQYRNHKTEIMELVNDSVHMHGQFYKLFLTATKQCKECYFNTPIQFRGNGTLYEQHLIYDNMLRFGSEMEVNDSKFYCNFCECFLFTSEYTDEMNCERCLLERNIIDFNETIIIDAIDYTFRVNE